MAKSTLTRAVKLTGTDVAEGKRRTLTAGPITAILTIVFSELPGTRPVAVLLSQNGRV